MSTTASSVTVPLNVTVNSFPPNGGPITDYTISPGKDFPALFSFDPKAASVRYNAIIPPVSKGRLIGPLPPGTLVNFVYKLETSGCQFGKLLWNAGPGPNPPLVPGVETVTKTKLTVPFTVSDSDQISTGKTDLSYSLQITQVGSSLVGIIDPDVEVDVTNGNIPP